MRAINKHHIVYGSEKHPEQEIIVPIYKGEHKILTLIQWYEKASVSIGFIKALKMFIFLNEDRADDLDCSEDRAIEAIDE